MKTLIIAISIGIAGIAAYTINQGLPALEQKDDTVDGDLVEVSSSSVDWSYRGAALFKANCSRCHSTQLEKDLTGPALYKVQERIPGGDWIYRWVADSQQLIKSGDPYAVQIYERNNRVQMDAFPKITREEVDLIMEFIASY